MKEIYKLSIPEPCVEDWSVMTPQGKGRLCASCAKTVVDFTAMTPNEIRGFLIENKNSCGRFKNDQLGTLTIPIPVQIIQKTYSFQKAFLLALFITMGATLVSCTDTQGKSQKIDAVEIMASSQTEDTIQAISQTTDIKEKRTSCRDTTNNKSWSLFDKEAEVLARLHNIKNRREEHISMGVPMMLSETSASESKKSE